MVATTALVIHPARFGAPEMAEILAAVVLREDDLLAAVAALAPTCARPIVDELRRLGSDTVAHDEISSALRWMLPEIHRELRGWSPAALV